MFDYILSPFKSVYNYTKFKLNDIWLYTILGYRRPLVYRDRVRPGPEFMKSLAKYQKRPKREYFNFTRDRFGYRPVNFTYEWITLKFKFEQFWVRRILWKFLHRVEYKFMRQIFRRQQFKIFKLKFLNINFFLFRNYLIPIVLGIIFTIFSTPFYIFFKIKHIYKLVKNFLRGLKRYTIFKYIERCVSICFFKAKLFDTWTVRSFRIPISVFKYYIGRPIFSFVYKLYIKIIYTPLSIIKSYISSSNLFIFLSFFFYYPIIFITYFLKKISLILINFILLIYIKIYNFFINIFFLKKYSSTKIYELKNNNLYLFKQFSQNCLKRYNTISFLYNYYIYFWLEYFIYCFIGFFYYILFLYKNNIVYLKTFIKNWIEYLVLYSYTSFFYYILMKPLNYYLNFWTKLKTTYKNTYYYLFGLGYDTYFYIFVKYLGIYTLKSIIFCGCLLFFDFYAFYFLIYRCIILWIVRKLIKIFWKYIYVPFMWVFAPHPQPPAHKYWFLFFCVYSTYRYFDDISGDEEEDEEEDALVSPMAVGYYDGFMHKDLFEDFPTYFAEDGIDYQVNKKIPWADKKLKMFVS